MGCEKVSEEEQGFSQIQKVNGTFREEIQIINVIIYMERGLALFNYIKMHMIFDLALYILSVFKDIVA